MTAVVVMKQHHRYCSGSANASRWCPAIALSNEYYTRHHHRLHHSFIQSFIHSFVFITFLFFSTSFSQMLVFHEVIHIQRSLITSRLSFILQVCPVTNKVCLHSFIHSFIHSSIHSFVDSFPYTFVNLFIHSLIH